MIQVKAVLFDLEGTLVDFQWKLSSAANEIKSILVDAGINLIDYGEYPDYAALFNTTKKLTANWPQTKQKKLFDRLVAIYDSYDHDALSRWELYPDTRPTLEFLFSKKYKIGVVSNIGKKAVAEALEKLDLLTFFELIISRNDVTYIKPNPEGLIKASEMMEIDSSDMLFVGDSANDIAPANKIKMASCFLSCGESNITKNHTCFATYTIKTLSELVLLLNDTR